MPLADKTYNEKRDFIRMRINSQVLIHHEGNDYTGICRDLSGTGMLVETQQSFELGTQLDVSIEQKSETHLPFNASTEVSRIQPGSENTLILGLSIKEIKE